MKATKIVFLVFVIMMSLWVVNTQLVKSQSSGTIYIRADGSVEGTDKIQRDGNVYTFTDNIYDEIVVQRDNIVVDGAHFSIYASDSTRIGIDLSGRTNVEVKNLEIRGFQHGIYLDNASSNTVYGNEIIGFSGSGPYGVPTGIWLSRSSNNKITSNNIKSNIDYGILIHAGSTDNTIVGNIITDNGIGLALDYCPNNTLKNNQMTGNDQNFKLGYNSFSQFIQDIDSSNTVDGKPIYYWVNEHYKTVPVDASFVALGNCTNITIRDLQISHSYDSITLINTNDSVITNNQVDKCGNGIFLKYCQNTNVTGNTVTGNLDLGIGTIACNNIIIAENNIDSCKFGISTSGQTHGHVGGSGSTNMTIYKNNITRNDPGIYLSLSKNNLISNNYIAKNLKGINAISSFQNIITENTFVENNGGAVRISGAQNNTFYHNNFIDNNASGCQISNPWLVKGNPEDNFWDDGSQGNYWNDFKQRYPNATEISGSGVWNTPYYINEKNIDHYPLVNPYEPETEPQQPEPQQSEPFPTLITATIVIVAIAVIGTALLVYSRKVKKPTGEGEKVTPEGVM